SPDGRYIAVNAADSSGNTMLWLHAMGALDFLPIPGTTNATRPFWSPDSRYVGFVADGKVKKVAVTGGPPQTICDAPTGSDGSWGTRGVIVFDGRSSDPIRRGSAAGGQATAAVKSDSGIVAWPEFLPDGRHFVFVQTGKVVGAGELCVGDIESKQIRRLGIQGSRAEYAPPGYLLFARDRTLLAQPFDGGALKVKGEPIPVADAIGVVQSGALAHFSVSDNGILIYSQGGMAMNSLRWVDRAGKMVGTLGQAADMFNV